MKADFDYFRDISFIQELSSEQNTERRRRGEFHALLKAWMLCAMAEDFSSPIKVRWVLIHQGQNQEMSLCTSREGCILFAVRRREDRTYELIGDCFLYDFDVYKLFDDESRRIKDFILR